MISMQHFTAGLLTLMFCGMVWQIAQHGATTDSEEQQALRELGWLNSAKPEQDVSAAIRRGDYRFITWSDSQEKVPGLEQACAIPPHAINNMPGSIAVAHQYEHRKLAAIAQVYAEEYNLQMSTWLQREGLWRCQAPA